MSDENSRVVEMYIKDNLGGKHSFQAKFTESNGKLIPTEETVCVYFKACKKAVDEETKACPIKISYEFWNRTNISFVESANNGTT